MRTRLGRIRTSHAPKGVLPAKQPWSFATDPVKLRLGEQNDSGVVDSEVTTVYATQRVSVMRKSSEAAGLSRLD